MKVLHLQRFGINVDDQWPEPNEDGSYPNGDDGDGTEKADQIDEMITDEAVDPDTLEPDDDDEMCEPVQEITARISFQPNERQQKRF
jgi:hypothetical protein